MSDIDITNYVEISKMQGPNEKEYLERETIKLIVKRNFVKIIEIILSHPKMLCPF